LETKKANKNSPNLRRRYADEYNIIVLVTNQIMDALQPESCSGGVRTGQTGGLQLISSGREVIPALGLAWSNCVNSRIFLSKLASPSSDGRNHTRANFLGPPSPAMLSAVAAGAVRGPVTPPQLRHMQIVFSPYLPQHRCAYIVESTGVRGLLPQEEQDAVADFSRKT